jgi:thermitase
MRSPLQGTRWSWFFLSLLLVVTGCSSGSRLVGVPSPSQNQRTGPPPLPSSDAGLAEHAPGQIVVGLLSNADVQRVGAAINGTVLKEIKQLSSVTFSLPPAISIVETIRKLQGVAGVKYAEPNYVYHPFLTPNDTFFSSKQWGPQKINAPAAWDITTGNPSSVVAVVDTGVDGTHPEFSGKISTGTNCTTELGITVGHGTHVAGIAAAIGNNGIGIAGIAWGAGILPIKVCTVSGCAISDIACGVVFGANFAISNPTIRVVENLSLGGPGYSQQLKDAVDYAYQNNVLVIASAGNDGKATVLYPAGYSAVMAVGATTPTNDRATFSTYGSQLSVVAPGVDIYSTLPGSSYGFLSGTSMAAPHISGVAALIRTLNPGFTPSQVRSQIEQTATRLGGSGFNPQFGWGLVNAAGAVGTPVANNYGSVQVSVTGYTATGPQVPGADVILWVGGSFCSGLTQEVQTTKTSSGTPGVGTAGVAVFNAVSAGSYCATAVLGGTPGKGATVQPFAVTSGRTTNASATIVPVPPFSSDVSGIYVANAGGTGITVFSTGASGNVAPIRAVPQTATTGITGPNAVALDRVGNVYVANTYNILVYPPGVSGNWFPVRTISGTSTGLCTAYGVVFDSADNLYVANACGNSVTVYAPGADGNVAPVRTISGASTGLNGPYGVALDSAGTLYVTNHNGNSITVYPPGATGDVPPRRTISGTNTGLTFPVGVAVDGAGNVYVTNLNVNSILMFLPDATGDVPPGRTISGANTGLNWPTGVALDSAGNLFVTNQLFNTITVYPSGTTGDAPPSRTIRSSNMLSTPSLITVR